jgi:hypothetical protein
VQVQRIMIALVGHVLIFYTAFHVSNLCDRVNYFLYFIGRVEVIIYNPVKPLFSIGGRRCSLRSVRQVIGTVALC